MDPMDRKHIAVVDENPFIARQVGRLIEKTGHRAVICDRRTPRAGRPQHIVPNMVLIGQRSREGGGWLCFNRWQETNPKLPLMLYVLDDCRPERLGILAQALHQALALLEKSKHRMAQDARAAAEAAGSS